MARLLGKRELTGIVGGVANGWLAGDFLFFPKEICKGDRCGMYYLGESLVGWRADEESARHIVFHSERERRNTYLERGVWDGSGPSLSEKGPGLCIHTQTLSL